MTTIPRHIAHGARLARLTAETVIYYGRLARRTEDAAAARRYLLYADEAAAEAIGFARRAIGRLAEDEISTLKSDPRVSR